MRYFVAFTGLFVASALVGCTEDVDSSAIRTRGMYADMSVLADGSGSAAVTVDLRVGGDNGTVVDLVSGDELFASSELESVSLVQRGLKYQGNVATGGGGTDLTVALIRTENDENAPYSWVTLPDDFSIDLPAAGDALTQGQPVDIHWRSASSDTMSLSVSGDCIFDHSETLGSDTGSATVTPDPTDTGANAKACPVELCLERARGGVLDPAFGEGGRVRGIQRRCVTFTSKP